VTSQGECSSSDEVYLADDQEAVDSMPPRILADEAPDVGGGPIRFAVSDNTVSDEGPRLNRAFVRIDPDGAASENAAMFMGGDLFRVVMPAVPPEGEVSYQLCAEDLAGNVGCTDTQTYGGGGGTTTGDETGNETTGESGGETSGETGSGTSGETGGNDEVDGTGDTAGAGDEGGCACSTSDAGGSLGWALLGLLGLGVVRRRRPQ
jgi:MYXO-CTERM domain-containing protein